MGRRVEGFDWAAAALAALAGAAVRFLYLWQPVTHDEAYTYIGFASRPLLAALSDYSLPNNHIFHTLLVWVSTRLFGIQPWAVRLPAYLAGVLLVAAVYFLALRWYNRPAALLAAGLAAAFPTLGLYASIARGYSLYALLSVLLALQALDLVGSRSVWRWAGFVLTGALLFYTLPTAVYPLGGLYAWLLLEELFQPGAKANSGETLRRVARLAGAGAATVLLGLLCYAPVFVIGTGWRSLFANSFVIPLPWSDFPATLGSRLQETWAEWTRDYPAALGWAGWAGVALSLGLHRRISRLRVPLLPPMLAWIALALLVQRANAWPRLWTFLIPFWLVWAAAGWSAALARLSARPLRVAAVAVVLALLAWGSYARVHRDFPAFQPGPGTLEKTARYLASQAGPEDAILIDAEAGPPLWYYARLNGISDASLMFLDRGVGYRRLFIVRRGASGMTLEDLLRQESLDPAVYNLTGARELTVIDDASVWLALPAAQTSGSN